MWLQRCPQVPPAPGVSNRHVFQGFLVWVCRRYHFGPSKLHLKPASMLASREIFVLFSSPISVFVFSRGLESQVFTPGTLGFSLLLENMSAAARVLSKFHQVLSNTTSCFPPRSHASQASNDFLSLSSEETSTAYLPTISM